MRYKRWKEQSREGENDMREEKKDGGPSAWTARTYARARWRHERVERAREGIPLLSEKAREFVANDNAIPRSDPAGRWYFPAVSSPTLPPTILSILTYRNPPSAVGGRRPRFLPRVAGASQKLLPRRVDGTSPTRALFPLLRAHPRSVFKQKLSLHRLR